MAASLRDLGDVPPVERAARAAALGLASGRWERGTTAALRRLADEDPDGRVRSAAVGALVRRGSANAAATAWNRAAADRDPAVRRRAAELATLPRAQASTAAVLALLADRDPLVAESAAFALGERTDTADDAVVAALAAAATGHDDPLVREAAVAALGSLGAPGGLAAILQACRDKPAIRRRAVLALAAFEGPEVDAELQHALADKDWQVRQAAEDLLED